jgi:hypothetical protein
VKLTKKSVEFIAIFDNCPYQDGAKLHGCSIKSHNCFHGSIRYFLRPVYEGVSKSFRTGRLERELQMVQLSTTRCSFIAILWISLVHFAAITTLCCFSTSNTKGKRIFRYRISPETSWYTIVYFISSRLSHALRWLQFFKCNGFIIAFIVYPCCWNTWVDWILCLTTAVLWYTDNTSRLARLPELFATRSSSW